MNKDAVVVAKPRSSNLELFRIIVMMLIVAHHYVVNSGLLTIVETDFPSSKSIFLSLFGCAGKIGIDCFVLITGYFMCTSKITLRKALKLLLQIEFYSIALFCIFVSVGYIDLTPKTIFKGVVPVTALKDGFVSCYLVFFCFIPFLNILIKGMTEKQHRYLLGLCLIVFSILPQVLVPVDFNYVIWFMVVYLIAAYFRLYPPQWSLNARYAGWGMVICIVLSLISVFWGAQLFMLLGKGARFYFFVSDSNKPLAVATALCAFLFFKNIKMEYSKVINAIAASAFGVLLIHANSDAMRQWLWQDVLDNVGHYSGNIYLHAFVSVLVVYAVCTMIDFSRIQLLEKPVFKFIDERMKKFSLYC